MTSDQFKLYNYGAYSILKELLDNTKEINDINELRICIAELLDFCQELVDNNATPTDAMIEHLKEKLNQENIELGK